MQQLNWDNLRYVLAVASKGSISAAARELGVNRSTVLRRIERFQDDLNCRIFNRSAEGYALTPEAEKMIEAAREVESTLYNMQRQLEGSEFRLEGELRVTTTDTFMLSLLAEPLARFRELHPHILIDLVVTNQILDLNRLDADIAIRPTQSPDERFTSRKLREVDFAVYATADRLDGKDWIGVTDNLGKSRIGDWLEENIEPQKIVIRCDSIVSVRACAEAGMGLALLPTVLAELSPQLQRKDPNKIEVTSGLWILTHPDLVRSARVNAFIEFICAELGE